MISHVFEIGMIQRNYIIIIDMKFVHLSIINTINNKYLNKITQ